MAYEKIGFSSGDVLTAVHMNHIEMGIGMLDTGKLDATALPEAINTALAQAKAGGEFDGAPGYTPVKGTDYYTAADKAELVNAVIAALPDASEVSY